jgi:hypothetical protein
MGERYFTGSRNLPPADKTGVGNSMVRRPERPRRDERVVLPKLPGDAVNLGRLQRFVERHIGDYCREPFREHRLPGAGRADHQHVVPAGGRHLERALHVLLTFDLAGNRPDR